MTLLTTYRPFLLNMNQLLVLDFIEQFDMDTDPDLWADLYDEELDEVIEAYDLAVEAELNESITAPARAADLLKELMDVNYTATGFYLSKFISGDIDADLEIEGDDRLAIFARAHDAMTKKIGAAAMAEAFLRVHRSNMSKLDDNGEPIYRADGKVLKGPNYRPPYLLDLVL